MREMAARYKQEQDIMVAKIVENGNSVWKTVLSGANQGGAWLQQQRKSVSAALFLRVLFLAHEPFAVHDPDTSTEHSTVIALFPDVCFSYSFVYLVGVLVRCKLEQTPRSVGRCLAFP